MSRTGVPRVALGGALRRVAGLAVAMAASVGLVAASDVAARPSEPPSQFGIDAPELAKLGRYAVGIRTMHLVQHDQLDVLAFDAATGRAPRRDRPLTVDVWYPARVAAGRRRVMYSLELPSEPPSKPMRFTVPGLAVRDAVAAGTGFPWIVVSHGYSGDPATMTWITENLASKGYVVVAIHHDDPPITDPAKRSQPVLRRPLDIVFVADTLRVALATEKLIDPSRLALLGYSQGGYGVLTAAGATLDPQSPLAEFIPGGILKPYLRGGSSQSAMAVAGVRAIVAISPAGGGNSAAWGSAGLLGIHAPLLLISGDDDRTVNYLTGARAFFDQALNAPRYLLTFKGAGHALGLNRVPDAMRGRLWDQDWFDDPVWDKERVNAIEAHFITAFLDLCLKNDDTRVTYLNVAVTESSAGVWPDGAPPAAYDGYSTGNDGITVWKGFQRRHAQGMQLVQAAPRER